MTGTVEAMGRIVDMLAPLPTPDLTAPPTTPRTAAPSAAVTSPAAPGGTGAAAQTTPTMTVTDPEETTTMTTTIHIDPEPLLAVLDERGWTQGTYDDPEGVCLHGAIRLCAPLPGDAAIIEQVAASQGWGTGWNDTAGRTEAEVRDLLARGIDITDEALAEVFGPQWRAVVALVRRAAALTDDEVSRLYAARVAARGAARDAAWGAVRGAAWAAAWAAAEGAAWDAAWGAVRGAAWAAARAAVRGAARAAAGDAAGDAARVAAGAAARVAVTWDLATPDGPYTIAHRDLLIAPWVSVCGLPDGLLDTVEEDR